jgi:hypothetical protein
MVIRMDCIGRPLSSLLVQYGRSEGNSQELLWPVGALIGHRGSFLINPTSGILSQREGELLILLPHLKNRE